MKNCLTYLAFISSCWKTLSCYLQSFRSYWVRQLSRCSYDFSSCEELAGRATDVTRVGVIMRDKRRSVMMGGRSRVSTKRCQSLSGLMEGSLSLPHCFNDMTPMTLQLNGVVPIRWLLKGSRKEIKMYR
ncbi:hypothetical protein AVEN_172490-1 [Araneus ventricosus]|uniref:Secreted protein n=1 Tax=Araneus ventricosus TaxID=182803 RepID=A0A4Y2DS91_ARAVE|nr:hypothetical protein AVEN_172490-1 [Araneus ventricosus]